MDELNEALEELRDTIIRLRLDMEDSLRDIELTINELQETLTK